MTVSLRDVILAVGYGEASMVGESAGYLILGAADCALTRTELANFDSITVSDEGIVALRGEPTTGDVAEKALRRLLGKMLSKVRIPSPNLERVAVRPELRGLRGLVTELEAALVPVNRRAARRTLARLCRESRKSAARQRQFAQVEEVEPKAAPLDFTVDEEGPVAVLPTPPPAPAAPRVVSIHAEQHVTPRIHRGSQVPTVPASLSAGDRILDAIEGFGAQTPRETVQVAQADMPRNGAGESYSHVEDSFHDEEDIDEEPTQVFLGVAPISAAQGGDATIMAVKVEPLLAPMRRRRRSSVVPARSRAWSEDDSLVVMSATSPRRRPSDINELLDRMAIAPLSTDELYIGLKSLSRIDLSPAPPAVRSSFEDVGRSK